MSKIVRLKKRKEESLLRFHPWVFSGAISVIEGDPEEGDVVDVYTHSGEWIAVGHIQIGSIAVRVLSFRKKNIDNLFWEDRIREAYELRLNLGLIDRANHNIYRLIYGEGDNLPGLIIDVYGRTAVIQAHSIGMHRSRKNIVEALKTVIGNKIGAVYYKSETTLPYNSNLDPVNGYIFGKKIDEEYFEYGLKMPIDWVGGQKTGFFIDQRENRALLESLSANRTVLNMFCYTGGFSIAALRGGANMVHSVDSSSKAMELTTEGIEMNFPADNRHKEYVEDAFKFLDNMEPLYDIIVLDPPAFAKHKDAVRNALIGYRRLNVKALSKIKPGGLLFSFSCSQIITKDQFRTSLFTAAAIAKKDVRVLYQLHQPFDHPINIFHPEGEYLKGYVLYVE